MKMSGMTREEAIEIIKTLPVYRAELIWGGESDLVKALNMGIEALEKQIPKKPSEVIEFEDGTFYRLDYMCTACNSATYGQPYKPKYCKHCGQALDWSEEND